MRVLDNCSAWAFKAEMLVVAIDKATEGELYDIVEAALI